MLGLSHDGGRSFEPVMSRCDAAPVACPRDSTTAMTGRHHTGERNEPRRGRSSRYRFRFWTSERSPPSMCSGRVFARARPRQRDGGDCRQDSVWTGGARPVERAFHGCGAPSDRWLNRFGAEPPTAGKYLAGADALWGSRACRHIHAGQGIWQGLPDTTLPVRYGVSCIPVTTVKSAREMRLCRSVEALERGHTIDPIATRRAQRPTRRILWTAVSARCASVWTAVGGRKDGHDAIQVLGCAHPRARG